MNNGHKESSVCLDRLIDAENVGVDFETIARSSPVDITAVDGDRSTLTWQRLPSDQRSGLVVIDFLLVAHALFNRLPAPISDNTQDRFADTLVVSWTEGYLVAK